MEAASTSVIRGQESFRLRSDHVELAITKLGGMLGPVTFFCDSPAPISPYHVAPWAEESIPSDAPPMLGALRGDWFCSAFGENRHPHAGQHLPPHGETANREWRGVDGQQTPAGSWLRLAVDLPLQGGRCEATTALIAGHSVVYQRHDFSGLTGPINPGHHATLQFRSVGCLSFSPLAHARTFSQAIDGPGSEHYSRLQADCEIHDLSAVPCNHGATTDLTRYPARRGFDDIVLLCADPTVKMAWSAVTFPRHGYVWFALRDPKQLASTLLWFSNGGRKSPPWNGRHIDVMGIEDITACFHRGIAASCSPNELSARGVRTCLNPDEEGRLSVRYIQGVARIPSIEFDEVALIEPRSDGRSIVLRSRSGCTVEVRCQVDFIYSGDLAELDRVGA